MSDITKYYTVNSEKFDKEKIVKEYKTLDGALKAAAKDSSLYVFDENGECIGSLVDEKDIPALESVQDVSNKTESESQNQEEEVGKYLITVNTKGSLRLRRTASFIDDTNICGKAAKGQQYTAKRIFMQDGIKMAETIDGLFLSAATEHVIIEKLD